MRMVGTAGQRLLRVELAVRGAQPALGHALHRLSALAHLFDILAIGTDVSDGGVDVHVFRGAGHPQVQHQRPGDFHVLGHRRRLERNARSTRHRTIVAGTRRVVDRLRYSRRHGGQRALGLAAALRWRILLDVQVELRPLRARDRPFVLVAERIRLRAAAGADLELDRRLVHHAGVDALEPVVEPAQLVDAGLERMERMEVAAGMDAQLLVLRGGQHVGLGVAAQVHREAAPVADAVHRHLDLVPLRALLPPLVGVEVLAHVLPQDVVVERIRVVAARAPEQVVCRGAVGPLRDEAHREDAAVVSLVAVLVRPALPGHDGLERRRLQVGEPVLERRMVRDAERAHVAVAPRLPGDPLDAVVGVEPFLVRAGVRPAGRLAGAAGVDAQQRIAARAPPQRVGSLPVHVRVAFLLAVVRRDPDLVLLVRPEVHDHRETLVATVGPEHVGEDQRAVAHRNLHVFLDDHRVVAGLRHLLLLCHLLSPSIGPA